MRASERITVRLHACVLAKARISTLTGAGGIAGPLRLWTRTVPGSGEKFVQKDDFEVQQEALWRWAADRVTPWGKVQKDDYDFRWIKGAPNNCWKLAAFTNMRASHENYAACSC